MRHGGHYMEITHNLMELTPVYILYGNIHSDDNSTIVMSIDGYPSYMFPGNYPGELTPYTIDIWNEKWALSSGTYTCIPLPISIYCYSTNSSYDLLRVSRQYQTDIIQ